MIEKYIPFKETVVYKEKTKKEKLSTVITQLIHIDICILDIFVCYSKVFNYFT